MSDGKNRHVVVLAFPFGTHAAPLLALVRRLSVEAPAARFSFFSTAASNNSLFSKDEMLENVKPYDVADGLPEKYEFKGNPLEPVEHFVRGTPGNFKEIVAVAVQESGRDVTCIMSDAFLWFAAEMAEEMQVPWLPLWTAGPCSLLLHVETDLLREKLGHDAPRDQTMDFLPGCSAIRVMDAPQGILSGDFQSPFFSMLHKMGQTLPQATAVVTNSFEQLDSKTVDALKSKFQKFLNVGPFVLTSPGTGVSDPEGCLEWLDKLQQHSVVYVSFGSVMTPPPDELAALAEALEESGHPFLWSLRENPEEKLPSGFLKNTREKGRIVSWAPQLQVLQHNSVGVFVTHCGWNSLSESIVCGVPMICRPFFGDQALNARSVEETWKIGKGIEGGKITKGATINALNLILSDEEGKEMRKKLEVLKGHALEAVQSNGSSTENFKTLVELVIQ